MRKATLASILCKSRHGVRLNEHLDHPEGAVVFQARWTGPSRSGWAHAIVRAARQTD
jgi:hypothetical protein